MLPERHGDWQLENLSLGDQFDYALHVVYEEPLDLDEALKSCDSSKWMCAMEEELESFKKNKTWDFGTAFSRKPSHRLQVGVQGEG